jgi:phosphoribosylformimino-5-aminoimidazole carboxamide ribotide isomerase
MLLVIPEIVLEEGKCKFCIMGEEGTELLYSDLSAKPEKLAALWRRENSKSIHISDFDSFKGDFGNFSLIRRICDAIEIPVQLYHNFRTIDDCIRFYEVGIYRLIFNYESDVSGDLMKSILELYTSSRLACYMKATIKDTEIDLTEFESRVKDVTKVGANRVWLGMSGMFPNAEQLIEIANISFKERVKITLYGAVHSPEDLWRAAEFDGKGIDSVVIGQPLYENKFPCQKIWRLIEKELE